mgnify:CR=1 FL=1
MLDSDNLAALTVAELVEHVRELRQANAQLRRQLRPLGPPLAAQALTEELIRQTALLTRLGIEFREDMDPTALVQQVLQSITVHLPADEATIILVGPDQTPQHALTVSLGAPRPLSNERAAELLTHGSAGWALRHGSSVILLDLAGETQWFQLREAATATGSVEPSNGSLIATPIRQSAATIGVLTVYRLATHAFGSQELMLIESIAAQIGIAISAARFHQQHRLRQQHMLTLLNFRQVAGSDHTAGDVAGQCHQIAKEVFTARWGLLFLRPTPQGQPEWIAPTNVSLEAPVAAAGGAVKLTVESQSVVTMALTDEQTCIAIPLIHDGHAIGGLALGYSGTQLNPSMIDWNLLELFARQTATVCANLQLVTRLREQTQLLEELVTERTNQLQRSRDLLRIVFDSLPEGVALLDETERLVAVNTVFANQIVGRHPRELVGKTYAQLLRMLERAAPTAIEFLAQRQEHQHLRIRQVFPAGERSYLIERMEIPPSHGQPASRLELWRREV